MDGGQAEIPTARTRPTLSLEVIEKGDDQRRIDRLKGQACRRRVQLLMRERQQQAEGVAIRTDRVRARLPLLHEALGEEPLQQRGEADGAGRHRRVSQHRSRRPIASRISSGHAVRYQ